MHDPVIGLILVQVGTCTNPDPSPFVMLGNTAAGVVNCVMDKPVVIAPVIRYP